MFRLKTYEDSEYYDNDGNITSPAQDVAFELMIAVSFMHMFFIALFLLFA
jgi:hypothetical protein